MSDTKTNESGFTATSASEQGGLAAEKLGKASVSMTAPPFKISSLWQQPVVNPLNMKSYTVPVLNLNNQYGRNFHLSWLGFFVAFLSWFAFPPLMPEAIRQDLSLLPAQVSNSNIIALTATLVVRVIAGPFVDRFGPRKVMASLLIIGAIPSGLAGVAHNAGSLYALRFFIGILGGTFVPCVAWTTCFFDKNVVGTANAFVAGWGNMGGGVTFVVMTALFQRLVHDGLRPHVAWRAAFAIVPVPILLITASLVLMFGTDHPNGKWSDRHNMRATAVAIAHGHQVHLGHDEKTRIEAKSAEKEAGTAIVRPAEEEDDLQKLYKSEVDVAINEPLTLRSGIKIVSNPLTWLPAFAYLTTFGYELAVDSFLVTILYDLFLYRRAGWSQLEAGYYTSIFGFLNLITRPAGGIIADILYKRFGVPGKKYFTLALGFAQGLVSIGLGVYISKNTTGTFAAASAARTTGERPELATIMGLIVLIAIFNELGNGANFALVPHCNPYSNGVVSGIVGAFGNLGGIIFALIFRFQGNTFLRLVSRPFWICGIMHVAINLVLCLIRVPKW